MLKPIKTFLTYLQRNANSSNIFGLTTTMGPTEQPRLEESIMIANEDLANESGDPLYDPLALDEDCPGVVAVETINVHNEVEDGVASGKIILVDVTTLKSSMDQSNELETDDEDAAEEAIKMTSETEELPEDSAAEVLTICSSSDVGGGSEKTCQIIGLDRSNESVIEVDSDGIILDSSTATDNDSFKALAIPVTPVMIVEEVVEIEQEKALPNGHDTADLARDTLDAPIIITPCDDQHQRNGENTAIKTSTLSKQIQGALPSGGAEAEEEEASDGSDSGLGLEPTRSVAPTSNSSNTPLELPPIKSSLKRRSEPATAASEVDEGVSKEKRPKKAITFEGVTVYYFPRIQGFGCVPSQGGCTLGMEFQHVHSRRLTLAEHSSEQRKVHRQQLQELNPRSSSSDDTSSEEEPSESGSEAESESYAFLQPVSTRQRRALLKAAGVRKIDSTEKDECREIRTSREVCGCTCRDFCDPATCACSLTGIKCQVDRPNFPCGCTQEGCANKAGRVEFNQGRVRTHFIHTIMRLNLEGKANEMHRPAVTNAPGASGSSSVVAGGTTGENGYVAESEKNWSNGPIRLQQQQQQQQGMVYVGGMHATALPTGPSGIEAEGTLVPMHHHHSLSPSQYHQPLPLQAQHQYFGPQTHESYMAEPAYHGYMSSNAQMLLTAVPTSTPHHLIDGLISPAVHSTDPMDVHYAYRDYFVGGTASGAAEAAAAAAASDQQLLPHGQLYYTYGGGSSPGVGGPTDPNYRHLHHLPLTASPLPPPPIHQLAETGSISPYHQQHTLPTGHDRHLTAYEDGVTPLSATGERDSTLRMSSATTSTTLDTPDGSSYPSSETPFPSNRVCPPEKEDSTNVSLSDSSADGGILLDSSVEEVVVNESETVAAASAVDNGSPSPVITVDDIDHDDDGDDDDDHRRTEQSSAKRHPSRRSENSDSERTAHSSCFIDLSAPVAGNVEHLEAINGMLASSRRSATLARRSIAAEDDDELRDFRHSPLPPTVTIDSGDDDDDDDDANGVIFVESINVSTPTPTPGTPLVAVNGNEESSVHQNGTEAHAGKGANARGESKRLRQDTTSPSHINSNDECTESSPVGSGLLPNKLAKTDTGTVPSTNSSSPPSPPGEPNENLCEIIKNSIVETAVSH